MTDADAGDTSSVKTPLKGLVDMGRTAFDNSPTAGITDNPTEIAPYAASFGGSVINLTWGQLQPTAGSPLGTNNLIDQELATIRAYNSAHPSSPLGVKLRVSAGFGAPEWAKQIGGAPIALTITKPNGQVRSGTVGRWWSVDYVAAWRAFQAALATTYDVEPLVREVAVTSCAVSTDEPMVPILEKSAVMALQAAGYDDAAQRSCLSGALDDYASWKTTWIDFTFNAFTGTDTSPPPKDPQFVLGIMASCTVASHCILATHYLDNPLAFKNDGGQDQNLFIYDQMRTQGDSLTDFQTAAPALLDWCGALANAHGLKGLSVELWPVFGGFTTLSAAQVANFVTALDTGVAADPTLCPPPR